VKKVRELIKEITGWSDKDLDKEVHRLMTEGDENGVVARNEISALNKILRAVKYKNEPVGDIDGYIGNLTTDSRNRYHLHLITDEGIKHIIANEVESVSTELDVASAVRVSGAQLQTNLATGSSYLIADKLKITPIDDIKFSLDDCIAADEPGNNQLVLVKGTVNAVFPVSEFDEEGNIIDRLPIISPDGTVNLRLIIATDIGDMTLKIPNIGVLEDLIGETDWVDDEAFNELRDMILNADVYAFGRFVSEINDTPLRQPFLDIRDGFVIMG